VGIIVAEGTADMGIESSGARRFLPSRWRNALLTAHIMTSVGLLGDSAGFAAVAGRLAATTDPAARLELLRTLHMFSLVFGIPLSVGTLASGIALGLGTKWGVFRYPWVVAKLALVISVMLVGSFVIGPSVGAMLQGSADLSHRLIAAASYDVIALGVATGLSVFKPGRSFRRAREVRPSTA
jgi:hypothetical protein